MGFIETVANLYHQVKSEVESDHGRWSTVMEIPLGDWSELKVKEEDLEDELEIRQMEKHLSDMLWKEIKGTAANDVVALTLTDLKVEALSWPEVGGLKNASLKLKVTIYFEMLDAPVSKYLETLATKEAKSWLEPRVK